VLILTFLAILSGACLALAWHYLLPRGLSFRLPRRAWALLLILPLPALITLLAFQDKTPDIKAAETASRNAQLDRAGKEAPHDLVAATAQLAARLEKEPNDQEGWLLLSRSYALLGQNDKAAEAARRAGAVAGDTSSAASQSATAEGLVTAADGTVTPEARQLFEATLQADPKDPRARFFLGLADAQAANYDAALTRWLALEADSPADAPWLDGLRANIDRLAGQMSLGSDDLARRRATLAKASPPAATPGPTQSDMAAAAQMSPEDRNTMIKSMVQRLADRLQKEPGDVDGWMRLGRAYAVLGEQQKSVDALRHAAEADPKREDARQAYASARAALGPDKGNQ
jgi:cytochrome c-type biogenesis protein CcmH